MSEADEDTMFDLLGSDEYRLALLDALHRLCLKYRNSATMADHSLTHFLLNAANGYCGVLSFSNWRTRFADRLANLSKFCRVLEIANDRAHPSFHRISSVAADLDSSGTNDPGIWLDKV